MPPKNGVQRHEKHYGRRGFRVKPSHSSPFPVPQSGRTSAVEVSRLVVDSYGRDDGGDEDDALLLFLCLIQPYRTKPRKRVTYVTAKRPMNREYSARRPVAENATAAPNQTIAIPHTVRVTAEVVGVWMGRSLDASGAFIVVLLSCGVLSGSQALTAGFVVA